MAVGQQVKAMKAASSFSNDAPKLVATMRRASGELGCGATLICPFPRLPLADTARRVLGIAGAS